MPALVYASLAAMRVTVLMSNIVGLRSLYGSEVRTDAATHTGFVVYCLALSADIRIAAAAPSPVGQHMYRVLGQAIGRAVSTSSSGVSFWYCAYGLWTPCSWFFTATFANCSCVVPYFRICSTPA